MQLRMVYLFCIVVTAFIASGKYFYDKGILSAQLACAKSKNEQLKTQFTEYVENSEKQQVESQNISKRLSEQIASLLLINEKSTKELRYAINQSANRVRCEFNADVMQQLEDARTQANNATTGGISNTLSTAGRTGE